MNEQIKEAIRRLDELSKNEDVSAGVAMQVSDVITVLETTPDDGKIAIAMSPGMFASSEGWDYRVKIIQTFEGDRGNEVDIIYVSRQQLQDLAAKFPWRPEKESSVPY